MSETKDIFNALRRGICCTYYQKLTCLLEKTTDVLWLSILIDFRQALREKKGREIKWFSINKNFIERISGINADRQVYIIKRLQKKGFLKVKREGRNYYSINDDVLMQKIREKHRNSVILVIGKSKIQIKSSFLLYNRNKKFLGECLFSFKDDYFTSSTVGTLDRKYILKKKDRLPAEAAKTFSNITSVKTYLDKSYKSKKRLPMKEKIFLLIKHWDSLENVIHPRKIKGKDDYLLTKTLRNVIRHLGGPNGILSVYSVEDVANAMDLFDELVYKDGSIFNFTQKFGLEDFLVFSDNRRKIIAKGINGYLKPLKGLSGLFEVFVDGEEFATERFNELKRDDYPQITDKLIKIFQEETHSDLTKTINGKKIIPVKVRNGFIVATRKLLEFWKRNKFYFVMGEEVRAFPGSTCSLIKTYFEYNAERKKIGDRYYFLMSDSFWKEMERWLFDKAWMNRQKGTWVSQRAKDLEKWLLEEKIAFYSEIRSSKSRYRYYKRLMDKKYF